VNYFNFHDDSHQHRFNKHRWGTGTAGYNGDGIAATTAQLNFPFYILFDQVKCNMYIADFYNNRIRLITGGFISCTPLPLHLLSFEGKIKSAITYWNGKQRVQLVTILLQTWQDKLFTRSGQVKKS
jgi:hypothetical protein